MVRCSYIKRLEIYFLLELEKYKKSNKNLKIVLVLFLVTHTVYTYLKDVCTNVLRIFILQRFCS